MNELALNKSRSRADAGRASTRQCAAFLSMATDCAWELDAAGDIVFVSEGGRNLLSLEHGAEIGRNFRALMQSTAATRR